MYKCILWAALALNWAGAEARSMKPYDPKPQSYQVKGQEVTSAEAMIAWNNGEQVFLCKALTGVQASKTYKVNGKEMKGSQITSCVEQELVGTKTGASFKAKK